MTKLPQDNRLHELLMRRVAPVEQEGFSDRILSASRDVMQRKNATLTVWLRRLFTEFSLPMPAYALAGMLVVGFLLGLGVQDFGATEANSSFNIIDSIFSEEPVL